MIKISSQIDIVASFSLLCTDGSYGQRSTTVVLLPSRRALAPPKPPQLDQKMIEITSPTAPTTIRMIPTVWMLKPDAVVLTAQAMIAPAAIIRRLAAVPIGASLKWWFPALPERHDPPELPGG
jgi:hypothetical protein